MIDTRRLMTYNRGMDKQTIIYIFAGAVLLAILIYVMLTSKKRNYFRLLSKIRTVYGAVPKREYTDTEFQKIRTYFDRVCDKSGYYVDDITWNDLDLDSIFIAMNHTFSSPGEEVLYDLLREPVFSKEELSERERLIHFFSENTKVREALEMEYIRIGRTKKYSLVRFLQEFEGLELKDNISYLGHIIALVIAFSVIFIKPAWGILALIAVTIYNVYSYYRDKTAVEPYYVSLSAMCYLVRGALRISEEKVPELSEYTASLRSEASHVRGLIGDMKWIGGGVSTGSMNNPLQLLMDYLRMVTHFDFIIFNRMVKKVLHNEAHLLSLFRTMGYLEAMISVASYRETIPFYCNGNLENDGKPRIHMKNGYHPLLKEPVANSLYEERPVLLTGSNASGKSTFLRTTALAALMAQTVNTVHATEYEGSFFRIYSSMALRDDVQSGDSYYITEIKALKRVMDHLSGEAPVLGFIDEVLRGTNTVERIAASAEILKNFAAAGAMIIAATHDIELTRLLEEFYSNYHFEEEISDGELRFNYRLQEGRATTRNAIKLLDLMGYGTDVTARAEESAERFLREGVWQLS